MLQRALRGAQRRWNARTGARRFGLKFKLWLSLGLLLLIALGILQFDHYRAARAQVMASLRLQARTLKTVMLAHNRVAHELRVARPPAFDAIPAHGLAQVARMLRQQDPSAPQIRVVGLQRPGAAQPLDAADAEALAYFQRHPNASEYVTRLPAASGQHFYRYVQPIWTEAYCLTCHGDSVPAELKRLGMTTPATGFREGDLRGLFSIQLPLEQIEHRIFAHFNRSLAGHLLVFLILFVAAGILLQRAVIDKLHRLQRATRGLAAGQYGQHVRIEGRDEIAALATAFNQMAERIAERDRQLSESEERLRLFIEHAPVAIAMFDRELRYLAVSPRWLEQFQLEDVIGRAHYALFPALKPQWREANSRALAGEVVENDEDAYVRPDGQTQWLRWSVRPWFRQDGATGGIVIFCEDISARRQAELALQQANRYNRGLLEAHLDPLFVIEPDGRIDDVNAATELATGRTRAELIGTQIADYFSDPSRAIASYREAFAQGRLQDCPLELMHRDGKRRMPVLCNATVYRDDTNGTEKLFGAARNITEAKRFTDLLQARMRLMDQAPTLLSADLLQLGVDEAKTLTGSDLGLYHVLNADGSDLNLRSWSPRLAPGGARISGLDGLPTDAQALALDPPSCPLADAGVLAEGVHHRQSVLVNHAAKIPHLQVLAPTQTAVNRVLAAPVIRNERTVALLTVANKPEDYDATDRSIVAAFADLAWSIIEQKRTEAALRASEARNRQIIETANEGIWIVNNHQRITFVNPRMAALLGYAVAEIVGQRVDAFLFPEDISTCRERSKSLQAGQSQQFERRFCRRDGATLWTLVSAVARTDEAGHVLGSFAMFTDITQLKDQQQRLQALAHFDPLTGLPNRTLLADRMHVALAQARRGDALLAVCYLDLDGFKPVNDTHGHEAGDRLLVAVAERLQRILREDDTVARLGGDEFALLLGQLSNRAECQALMERLLTAIAEPYTLDPATTVAVSASIGLTLYPPDQGDADTLLRHADIALYQAKEAGRGCFRFFAGEASTEND